MIGDEGDIRLLETLKKHNGTMVQFSLTHDLQRPIYELVNANKKGTPNPPLCPRTRPKSEFFGQALKASR
jgi:hypothetical protein